VVGEDAEGGWVADVERGRGEVFVVEDVGEGGFEADAVVFVEGDLAG
jgi:hypothetical protein